MDHKNVSNEDIIKDFRVEMSSLTTRDLLENSLKMRALYANGSVRYTEVTSAIN